MKSLFTILIFIGSILPAEAQVTRYLAKKGEKVDFDTAIVIKLEVYRKEFKMQQVQNKLIDSLHQVLTAQKKQEPVLAQQPVAQPSEEMQVAPAAPIVKEKRKGLKWYFNPLLYLGAGLLMGVYLVD
jgi:hypothetical protein